MYFFFTVNLNSWHYELWEVINKKGEKSPSSLNVLFFGIFYLANHICSRQTFSLKKINHVNWFSKFKIYNDFLEKLHHVLIGTIRQMLPARAKVSRKKDEITKYYYKVHF